MYNLTQTLLYWCRKWGHTVSDRLCSLVWWTGCWHPLYCLTRTKTQTSCRRLCNKRVGTGVSLCGAASWPVVHLLWSTDACCMNCPTDGGVHCTASKSYPHSALVILSSWAAFVWARRPEPASAPFSIGHFRGMLTGASPNIHSRFCRRQFWSQWHAETLAELQLSPNADGSWLDSGKHSVA